MLRAKTLQRRLIGSGISLLAGLIWFAGLGGIIAGHLAAMFIFFCAIPLCLAGATHLGIDALFPHLQRAGYAGMQKKSFLLSSVGSSLPV